MVMVVGTSHSIQAEADSFYRAASEDQAAVIEHCETTAQQDAPRYFESHIATPRTQQSDQGKGDFEMSSYDKWINTYPINPPVGGKFSWGAKANVKQVGTGRTDDAITLSEHLGETEYEAESKAAAEAEAWIAQPNTRSQLNKLWGQIPS